MKSSVLCCLSLLICLGVAWSAPAATIDFTDPAAFGAAQGEQSFTWTEGDVGRVELSAAPPPGTLSFDFDTATEHGMGVGVDCVPSGSWRGCREWLDDATEIDAQEVLTVSFLDETVQIDSFTVAGLSRFEWGIATGETFAQMFMGDGTGLQTVELGRDADWISFHARLWSDYSLVSLDYSGATSPMPEANSAILFVIGGVLVGGAVGRRVRRSGD